MVGCRCNLPAEVQELLRWVENESPDDIERQKVHLAAVAAHAIWQAHKHTSKGFVYSAFKLLPRDSDL